MNAAVFVQPISGLLPSFIYPGFGGFFFLSRGLKQDPAGDCACARRFIVRLIPLPLVCWFLLWVVLMGLCRVFFLNQLSAWLEIVGPRPGPRLLAFGLNATSSARKRRDVLKVFLGKCVPAVGKPMRCCRPPHRRERPGCLSWCWASSKPMPRWRRKTSRRLPVLPRVTIAYREKTAQMMERKFDLERRTGPGRKPAFILVERTSAITNVTVSRTPNVRRIGWRSCSAAGI